MTDDLGPPTVWWAVVELTDHHRVAGRLSEQVVAGTPFLRIDVPAADGRQSATQLYAPHAVYSITPVDEAVALRLSGQLAGRLTGQLSGALADRARPPRPEPAAAGAGYGSAAHDADAPDDNQPDDNQPDDREPDDRAAQAQGREPRDGDDADRVLLTVSELASRYACSRSTVMRWQTFTDFPEPAVRGPRRLAVYELTDVEQFLARHPELLRAYQRR